VASIRKLQQKIENLHKRRGHTHEDSILSSETTNKELHPRQEEKDQRVSAAAMREKGKKKAHVGGASERAMLIGKAVDAVSHDRLVSWMARYNRAQKEETKGKEVK